ncbi:MAG: hypothetical protein HN531_05125 [Opitutae bacterium]|nr:hypothetical protein [Opitutae bacterium]
MRPGLPLLFLALLLCGCGEGVDPQAKPQPDGKTTSENAGLSQEAVRVLRDTMDCRVPRFARSSQ